VKTVFAAVAGAALLLGAVAPAPLSAHHSTAMFDQSRTMTLEGAVATFQWTNPHAWIQVTAPGPDGEMTEWSIECSSPNTLSRQGWTPRLLTPGQALVIVINPMQDGTNAGLFVGMRLDDGQVFGNVSAAAPGNEG
jgi:hypothetical protein